jgi:hypothetical protein
MNCGQSIKCADVTAATDLLTPMVVAWPVQWPRLPARVGAGSVAIGLASGAALSFGALMFNNTPSGTWFRPTMKDVGSGTVLEDDGGLLLLAGR